MGDPSSSSSISFAIDDTIADLDRLRQTDRARKSHWLERLQRSVDDLGIGTPPEPESGEGQERGRIEHPAGIPFLPLPRRNTPGGNFGPAVRDQIRLDQLAKLAKRW